MIGILDYGMGNLHSVSKALERLGQAFVVSDFPEELEKADGLILPGVGSFKDAMHILAEGGLADFLRRIVAQEKPLFGICLGMQLLFSEGKENGLTTGLDFLPGRVERFSGIGDGDEHYKVPHMGWNRLRFHRPNHPILQGLKEDYAYFVHSYVVRARDNEDVLASTDYFREVPAIVGHGNVFGAQFHPEKSSKLGMALLNNFCTMVESEVVR